MWNGTIFPKKEVMYHKRGMTRGNMTSPVQAILSRLSKVQGSHPTWTACCPAHEDRNPSLSIKEADSGTVLLHCHAGCETENVATSLGLKMSDLYPGSVYGGESPTEVYSYEDEQGSEVYQVLRYPGKSFPFRQPDGLGGWRWTSEGVIRVPYRLPEVIQAITKGEPIVITEGEKDVHTIESFGYTATCCPGGAKGWKADYAKYFDGANILLCGDNDDAGRQYLISVAKSCSGAASIRRIDLPPLAADVSDWVYTYHGTEEEFRGLDTRAYSFDWRLEEVDYIAEAETSTGSEGGSHESRLHSDREVMKVVHMWGFEEPEPMKWTVSGIIPEGYVTVLAADGGTGKSFLALELMYCVATGTPFLGQSVQKASVLYVDFELQQDDQKRRWCRILKGRMTDQHDGRITNRVFFHRPSGSLSDRSTTTMIKNIVEQYQIGFVVIDSLTIGLGADAKSQDDVTKAMNRMSELPSVLAIDHVSHQQRHSNLSNASAYGSVFKRNIARSMLVLGKADGGGLVLRQNKTNFGPEQDIVCFEMVFADEANGPVSVELRSMGDAVMVGAERNLSTLERTYYHAIQLLDDGATTISPEEIASRRMEANDAVAVGTIRNHLSRLKKQGKVENVGSNSWVPVRSSSSSLSLGAVNGEEVAHTGIPSFSTGQPVLTPRGTGTLVENVPSVHRRLPVRLTESGDVQYFEPGEISPV